MVNVLILLATYACVFMQTKYCLATKNVTASTPIGDYKTNSQNGGNIMKATWRYESKRQNTSSYLTSLAFNIKNVSVNSGLDEQISKPTSLSIATSSQHKSNNEKNSLDYSGD